MGKVLETKAILKLVVEYVKRESLYCRLQRPLWRLDVRKNLSIMEKNFLNDGTLRDNIQPADSLLTGGPFFIVLKRVVDFAERRSDSRCHLFKEYFMKSIAQERMIEMFFTGHHGQSYQPTLSEIRAWI